MQISYKYPTHLQMHLPNRPASTIKNTDNRISSLYHMEFTSCNEQHDTFLLTQLKTKGLGSFQKNFFAFCNATKETGKYKRSTCHTITACKYTKHVNVAAEMCTYILEMPSSILGWRKLQARKRWESWPTSIVQQQLDPRLCTIHHLPVTLPSTSRDNMIQ